MVFKMPKMEFKFYEMDPWRFIEEISCLWYVEVLSLRYTAIGGFGNNKKLTCLYKTKNWHYVIELGQLILSWIKCNYFQSQWFFMVWGYFKEDFLVKNELGIFPSLKLTVFLMCSLMRYSKYGQLFYQINLIFGILNIQL